MEEQGEGRKWGKGICMSEDGWMDGWRKGGGYGWIDGWMGGRKDERV